MLLSLIKRYTVLKNPEVEDKEDGSQSAVGPVRSASAAAPPSGSLDLGFYPKQSERDSAFAPCMHCVSESRVVHGPARSAISDNPDMYPIKK